MHQLIFLDKTANCGFELFFMESSYFTVAAQHTLWTTVFDKKNTKRDNVSWIDLIFCIRLTGTELFPE